MKSTLITIFIVTLFSISFGSNTKSGDPKYVINENEINIGFTTQYIFSDLVKVKAELEALGIKIIYTSLKFNDDGNLMQISATIEYADGKKGSFVSRELMPEDSPGFRRKFK